MYMKPYYGKMWRNFEYVDTKFYDEREWRWIPEIKNNKLLSHLIKTEFFDEVIRKRENKKLGANHSLNFEPSDIKYLIIKEESEIAEFIKHLEKFTDRFDPLTIKKLTTRILTTNQIKYDF